MTQPLTFWLDYDRSRLAALSPLERIDYFERRVRRVAINPLDRILTTEIEPTADSSALLIFGVALCCAIEASGKFVCGGAPGNEERFKAFLAPYMSSDFQNVRLGPLTYGQVLWKHFRNGLAHGFSVCHGGFEGVRGQPYFAVKLVDGLDVLEVNPSALYDDFVIGFNHYISDLRASQPGGQLFLSFDRVFNSVFVCGD